MKFAIYRPFGNAHWNDDEGRKWYGYESIEPARVIEAADAQDAINKARSYRDPAPIVEALPGSLQ